MSDVSEGSATNTAQAPETTFIAGNPEATAEIDGSASSTSDGPKEFALGLALAGAISAGAYTAGVIDFLVQALDEWQKEKATKREGVPGHLTGIKVIAGASAGSITGALGLVALARGLDPQELTPEEKALFAGQPGQTYNDLRCVLPKLYTAWVLRPRMVGVKASDRSLLSLEDLEDNGTSSVTVASLLNSTLLTEIATEALKADRVYEPPATRVPPGTKPYLARDLHLYMTVSNLRGIPFTLSFGQDSYGMQTHGDRVHYRVRGLGEWISADSAWLAPDSKETVEVKDLPEDPEASTPDEWQQYALSALASSAFPIGLASRALASKFTAVASRSYPLDIPLTAVIKPTFPAGATIGEEFRFLNVDGGLVNNNPYDYAEYTLLGRPAERRAHTAQTTGAAVIMVAPFPEPPAFLPEGQPHPDLVSVIRSLLPTLTTQARFRPNELAQAMDPENYSRYLIAPRRRLPGKQEEERYAIASGLLGGFGGFLDEAFRAHDYQLGRRNCQQFLANTFALPTDSLHIDVPKGARRIAVGAAGNAIEQAPVIPLLGTALPEVALPAWPRMSQVDFETLMTRISIRLSKVAPMLLATQTHNKWLGLVGRTALLLGKPSLLKSIRWAILSDLIRRDQVEGWDLPKPPAEWPTAIRADDVRAVLAELASPSFAYRTLSGIALATHLPRTSVDSIITFLSDQPSGNVKVVEAAFQTGLLTLEIRQDAAVNLPIIGGIRRWFDPPQHDPI